MSTMNKLAKELKSLVAESDGKKPKPFDTTAEVVKVEGDIAWVHMPGGVDSTPVRLTMNAKKGDKVQVRVANGSGWLVGNVSNPPTDDTVANTANTTANKALTISEEALRDADRAKQAADRAEADAIRAYDAADRAETEAGRAYTAATAAQSSADAAAASAQQAISDASAAHTAADAAATAASAADSKATAAASAASAAQSSADAASSAAATADAKAVAAGTAASNAQSSADAAASAAATADSKATAASNAASAAQRSADSATVSANSALTQLGVVEDIVGVLEWISEHASYKRSADTEVVAGKMYFTKSGDTYTPIANPTGNPSTAGYYEIDNIDEAVSNYVSSHLSLTNAGLWVVNDNNSYKILLASDGMKVYDASGNLVSTFGENIIFDSTRNQYIGGENAYILYNTEDGILTIGGNNIVMGSKSLSEVMATIDGTLIYDHTYEYITQNGVKTGATFTAALYRGGIDVKTEYDPTCFSWYLKKEDTDGQTKEVLLGTGYSIAVSLADCGYGAEIIGKCIIADESEALNNEGDNLTDINNDNISVRATGESVRVRDLTVSSVIFPTEKLLVVGASDEHLVSIQTLQDYLNLNLDKQVLFDTTTGWSAQTSLVSQPNTLYVYTDHQVDSHGNNIAGIKVGDGNAYVVDLPFTDVIATEHIENETIHITATERDFWNNKVRCYYAGTEQLIFTTA